MGKRIVKAMSIIQIVLVIVAYIAMSFHFVNDYSVFSMLADTDFVATALRVSLYAVPGMHLLSGLYGLVFSDKKILVVIGVAELISCGLSFTFVGHSQFMLILSISSCVISLLYLFGVYKMKSYK